LSAIICGQICLLLYAYNFSKFLDPSAIDLFENKEEKGTEHDNLSFEKELRLMQKVFF